jgi:hypothetical protein
MYRLKKFGIILLSVVLLNGSCNNSSKQDLSLTVKEYQKAGMPDPSKTWKNYDYVNANLSLGSLHATNPFCLPRKDSKKSGTLFSRFVNIENLKFLDDTTISLRDRALLVQHFQQLHNQLSNFYNNELEGKPYYNKELIDLHIFRLLVNEKMLELAGKIMNSKEESDLSLQSGLNRVRYNYLKLIYMMLEVQLKSRDYPGDDLNRLSTEVSRSLALNQIWMEPPVKQKLIVQVQHIIKESSSAAVKKNYRKTLEILKD